MLWGCGLCTLLAGGALLVLLLQLLRWLRADGDLTVLWAEWRGKKPGKAACLPAAPARQEAGGGVGCECWWWWWSSRGWVSVRGRGAAVRGGERFPRELGLKLPQLRESEPRCPRGLSEERQKSPQNQHSQLFIHKVCRALRMHLPPGQLQRDLLCKAVI